MDKVAILQVLEKPFDEEIYADVRQVVDMIGGPRAFAGDGDVVLIKPNWWWLRTIRTGDYEGVPFSTTDRRIVVAAARMFGELGCKVKIGEDPECFLRVGAVFDSMNTDRIAELSGAEVVNMRKNGTRTVPTVGGKEFAEMQVFRDVLDADLVVNLPVMKTNFLTTLTCCLKNMKGVIPPTEKRAFHQRALSQGVADLGTIVRPRLNIVEAVIGHDVWNADNPTRYVGCLLAGDNPLSTDAVVARIMGYEPAEVEHLALAHELGLGELDTDRIELIGASIDEVRAPFTGITDMISLVDETPGLELVQGRVCSACLGALGMALNEMGPEPFADGKPVAVIAGPDAEPLPDPRNVFLGTCTRKTYEKTGGASIFIRDCPPTCNSTKLALLKALDKTAEQGYHWDIVTLATD